MFGFLILQRFALLFDEVFQKRLDGRRLKNRAAVGFLNIFDSLVNLVFGGVAIICRHKAGFLKIFTKLRNGGDVCGAGFGDQVF